MFCKNNWWPRDSHYWSEYQPLSGLLRAWIVIVLGPVCGMVDSGHCTVHSGQWTACSVQSTVDIVQCAVYSEHMNILYATQLYRYLDYKDIFLCMCMIF